MLLNRPALWATKFHYALIFGVLGVGLSTLTVWLLPVELTAVPNAWHHMLSASILSVIGLAVWIWQVSLFKTEKAFGEAGLSSSLRDQAIYIGVILMAMALPILHGYRVSEKVARAIDEKELIADLNHLNVLEAFANDYYYLEEGIQSNEDRLLHYNFHTYSSYPFTSKAYPELAARLHRSEANYERFLQLAQPQREGELLQAVEKYLALLQKYSKQEIYISAKEIVHEFGKWGTPEQDQIAMDYRLDLAEESAEANLAKLQDAKVGDSHVLIEDRWKGPAILFLYGFGLLLIGLQSNGRSFLVSAIVGGALVTFGVLVSDFAAYSLNLMRFETMMSSLHLGAMLLLGLLMLKRKSTQKGVFRRQIILSLFVTGLAFVPFSVWQIAYAINQDGLIVEKFPAFGRIGVFEYLLFGGAVLPILLWNLGLRQAFIRLEVRPKSR